MDKIIITIPIVQRAFWSIGLPVEFDSVIDGGEDEGGENFDEEDLGIGAFPVSL